MNKKSIFISLLCGLSLTIPTLVAAAGGLQFTPPMRGAPSVTVGGGTRFVDMMSSPVSAIASPKYANTLQTDPSIFWFVRSSALGHVKLTIKDKRSGKTIYSDSFKGAIQTGIQGVSVADLGVKLKPGKTYTWQVTLDYETGDPTENASASGTIRVKPASSKLTASLAKASSEEKVKLYDKAGYLYDALAQASSNIQANPNASAPRIARANLLARYGFSEEAASDKSVFRSK